MSGGQGVASSNLAAPTNHLKTRQPKLTVLLWLSQYPVIERPCACRFLPCGQLSRVHLPVQSGLSERRTRVFGWFKRRDVKRYPKDEVGDELWRYVRNGGKPDQPSEMDFNYEFSSAEDARHFADALQRRRFEVIVEHCPAEDGEAEYWEVDASRQIPVSYLHVKAELDQLNALAKRHRGEFVYWLP